MSAMDERDVEERKKTGQTMDAPPPPGNLPRPEEVIAAVYGRISTLREAGKTPSSIVLPPALYRIIQDYRARLGESPREVPDYLGKYEMFGLPLYTDSCTAIVIRTRPGSSGAVAQ
ncbi:hypothetical protein AU468_03015 [Alkalispirochaeta sphaeroplastigenens]|uniref:Uncharacterized protein n=1 Tax=Alkalispirochaeta sphaeroplastigenens TaxID=1187066 RepID=A0A2S4JYS7_9SPIO|nr:hypothetical protein [Alkalispirochaeta sphaeroplastigenens]POR04659.1 hypothetical protein AU468_03015 [Alkalispirochaeta sphaeroplastigenens]